MAANLLHEKLPQHWSYGVTSDGRVFFLDDRKRRTTWLHPVSGKPIQTGHQPTTDLPIGFEEGVSPEGAFYVIDHNTETTSFDPPSTRQITHSQQYSPSTVSPSYSPTSPTSPTSPIRARKGSGKQKSVKAPSAKRNTVVRPTIQGYLFRLESGDLKSWKKRWCVLSEFGLFFYKDSDEKRSTGSLLLPGYTIVPCSNTDYVGRQFAFKAEHENTTTEYLSADNQNDMDMWMNTLNMAAQLKKDPRSQKEMNNNNYVQFNQGPLIPKSPFITRNGDGDDDPIPPPFAHKYNNPDYIHPYHTSKGTNDRNHQNNTQRGDHNLDNRGIYNQRDNSQNSERSHSMDPYSLDVRRSQSSLAPSDLDMKRSQSWGPNSHDRHSYSSQDPRSQRDERNQSLFPPSEQRRSRSSLDPHTQQNEWNQSSFPPSDQRSHSSLDPRSEQNARNQSSFPPSDQRRSHSSLDPHSQQNERNQTSFPPSDQRRSYSSLDARLHDYTKPLGTNPQDSRSQSSLIDRLRDNVHPSHYSSHDSDSWRNDTQNENMHNLNSHQRDSLRDSRNLSPNSNIGRDSGPMASEHSSSSLPHTFSRNSSSSLNHVGERESYDNSRQNKVPNTSGAFHNSNNDIPSRPDNSVPYARQSVASTVSVPSIHRFASEDPYMYMSLPESKHGELSKSQSLPYSRTSYGDPRNSSSFSHPPDIIQPHSVRSSLAHDRTLSDKMSPDDIPEERSWKNPADRYLELKPQRHSRADSDILLEKGRFSTSQSVPELHRIEGHKDDVRYTSQLIPPIRKEARNNDPDRGQYNRVGPDDPVHTYMNFPQRREEEWQNSGNFSDQPVRPPLPASMRHEIAHHLALSKTPISSEDIRRAAENEKRRLNEKPFFRYPTPEVERKDGFPENYRGDPMKSTSARSSYASDRNRPDIDERRSYNPLFLKHPSENSEPGSNMGDSHNKKPVDRDRRRTVDNPQSLNPGDRQRMATHSTNNNEGFYSPIQAERAHSMSNLNKPVVGGGMLASGVDLNKSIESLIEGERTSAFTPLSTAKKGSERRVGPPDSDDRIHQQNLNNKPIQNQPGVPQMSSTPSVRISDSDQSLLRHDNYGIVPSHNYNSEGHPQRHSNKPNTIPIYDRPDVHSDDSRNYKNPHWSENYQGSNRFPPSMPDDKSEETEVKRFSTASSQRSNQSRGYPREPRQPEYPPQPRSAPNTLGMHTVKEDPDMPDEAVFETKPNLGRKYPINGSRLRMSISAGDLIGKTQDELVLLLIQLRRNNSGVEKARDFYRESLEKFRPGEHEYRKKQNETDGEVTDGRLVMCHKQFVEMRNLCDDVEKKLEVYRPIINLVDNMVTMGSLYGGDNMMLATQYRKHLLRPDQYTPAKKMLEFSRQHQEDKFLNEMEEEIRKLTKDEVALEEKLDRLFELDRGIQELSFKVNSCREDKDLMEKALQGILKQQDFNRNNPRELDKLVQQQRTIEKELSRVMHQLADYSKELEIVTAENNKVELDVTLLRSKVQSELSRSKSAPSLAGDGEKTKVKMERELAKVENMMAGLSAEGARLSEVMNNLRRSSSGAKYAPGLDDARKKGGTYKETDLDTSNTTDLAVDKNSSSPSQYSSQKHKPAREYIPSKAQLVRSPSQNFEPKHAKVSYISRSQPNLQKASLIESPTSPVLQPKKFGSLGFLNTESNEDQPPLPERRYGSDYALDHQQGYAEQPSSFDQEDRNQWDISEADDNTKRFYGLIPKDKPKLLTVRDVKRQAEQRRERDKRKDEMSTDDPDGPWQNPEEKIQEAHMVGTESGFDSGLYTSAYHQRYPSDISDLYASARAEPFNSARVEPFNSSHYKDPDPVYENLPRFDPLRNISSVQFNPNSSAPSSRRSSIHLFTPKPFTPYQDTPGKQEDTDIVVKSENMALQSENRVDPRDSLDLMNQYNNGGMRDESDFNRNIHNYHIDLSQPNNYSIDVQSPSNYSNNFDSMNNFNSLTVTDNNNSSDFNDKSPSDSPPWKQYHPPVKKEELKERKSPRRRVGRYLTISSSEPIKLEVLSPRNRERHTDAGVLISSTQIDEVPDIVKSSTARTENIDEYTFDSLMFLPEKVLIPERYDPSSDVEVLSEEEKQKRQEKAEKIKKLLAVQSLHSLSQPDISQLNKNPHTQAEQEKRMRAKLLTVGQELAKEVSMKTKEAAVKRRKTWSGTPALTDEQIYGTNNDETVNKALNMEQNIYDDNYFL